MESLVVSVVIDSGGDADSLKKAVASKAPGCVVQVVRRDVATNGKYVEMVAVQTLLAKGTANQLAKRPEVDLLLRLARTTQISRAIGQVGVRKGEPFLLVVAGSREELSRLRWGDIGGTKLANRGLSPEEMDGIEEAALLNAGRAR